MGDLNQNFDSNERVKIVFNVSILPVMFNVYYKIEIHDQMWYKNFIVQRAYLV